jgi:hypothetical protein
MGEGGTAKVQFTKRECALIVEIGRFIRQTGLQIALSQVVGRVVSLRHGSKPVRFGRCR